MRAEVWILELKAATSWCQNFLEEGHFRDSNLCLAIRDGGSHGLRGVPIDTDELAGSEKFKNDLFQDSGTGTPRHNSESSGVQFSNMDDGDGVESSVAAGGAESVISLCIPW